MTRTDTAVIGTLLAVLALIAGLIAAPVFLPAAATPSTSASPGALVVRPYREGVVGHPVSVSPLTARTQADRDLVALVFSGLVKTARRERSCRTWRSPGRSIRAVRRGRSTSARTRAGTTAHP